MGKSRTWRSDAQGGDLRRYVFWFWQRCPSVVESHRTATGHGTAEWTACAPDEPCLSGPTNLEEGGWRKGRPLERKKVLKGFLWLRTWPSTILGFTLSWAVLHDTHPKPYSKGFEDGGLKLLPESQTQQSLRGTSMGQTWSTKAFETELRIQPPPTKSKVKMQSKWVHFLQQHTKGNQHYSEDYKRIQNLQA